MEAAGGIVGIVLVVIAIVVIAAWVLFPLLVLDRMSKLINEVKRGNDFAEKSAWYIEQQARVGLPRTD